MSSLHEIYQYLINIVIILHVEIVIAHVKVLRGYEFIKLTTQLTKERVELTKMMYTYFHGDTLQQFQSKNYSEQNTN